VVSFVSRLVRIILINDLKIAEILYNGVELDLEPSLEHREISVSWPPSRQCATHEVRSRISPLHFLENFPASSSSA
jgi:hypothetical protein